MQQIANFDLCTARTDMTKPADFSKSAQHTPPGNVLYRSRAEICRILQFLASDNCPVSAEIGNNRLFVSHILSLDPGAGYFVVAYSADKPANSVLFGLPSLEFTANPHRGHLVFQVSSPVDMQFDGQPAIQFALPQSVILNHRRKQARIPVPEDISLRCVADEGGVISFEARITDISLGGMGGLLYSGDIVLEAGTILKGCRIIIPGGKAVIADLEVRYTKAITSPEGTPPINRAGVRFVQKPDGIETLIDMFAQNPDNTTTPG